MDNTQQQDNINKAQQNQNTGLNVGTTPEVLSTPTEQRQEPTNTVPATNQQTTATQNNAPLNKPVPNNKMFENAEKVRKTLGPIISKIPYIGTPDLPLTSTTQDHQPIADIAEDVVLYKDGGAAIVMESSSLNFGLLSEKEQQAVVAAFAALINSLSYAIQIVVRTQRKDISGYIRYFDEKSSKITNPRLAAITADYRHFITDSIKKKTVLGKRFFVAIPFSPLELGVTKSAQSVLRKGPLPFPRDYVLKKAKVTLYPKKDHLIRQAGRLGLKLKQLTTEQLIELYWQINNPEPPAVKKDI